MRKTLCIFAMVASAGMCFADTATVSLTVTNGQAIAYSDPIILSGYIDHIEVTQDNASTSTVTIATYSGTTAIDTYASLSGLVGATKLVRPRLIGTDNTGTALTGAVANSTAASSAATTVLIGVYSKPLAGGNLKMAVTGTKNDGSNTVTAKIFYQPLHK